MVVILGNSHVLRRLKPRRRSLVHHLLLIVLGDKHDTMMTIMAYNWVSCGLWLIMRHWVLQKFRCAFKFGLSLLRFVALARRMLLVELNLMLCGFWWLLFLRRVHLGRLLGYRYWRVVAANPIIVLEDGLLLHLVLRWTDRLSLALLFFFEDLRQVRLALKSFIWWALITFLYLTHASAYDGTTVLVTQFWFV